MKKVILALLVLSFCGSGWAAEKTKSGKETKSSKARKVATDEMYNDENRHLSCSFKKSYDRQHLKKYPKQTVELISGSYNPKLAYLTVDFYIVNKRLKFTTGLIQGCMRLNNKETQCNLDGDGGNIVVTNNKDGKFRLVMHNPLLEDPNGNELVLDSVKGGDDKFDFDSAAGETNCDGP